MHFVNVGTTSTERDRQAHHAMLSRATPTTQLRGLQVTLPAPHTPHPTLPGFPNLPLALSSSFPGRQPPKPGDPAGFKSHGLHAVNDAVMHLCATAARGYER